MSGEPLAALLERHRAWLVSFVEREGSGLLRYEGVDDLVQGIHLRAVAAGERFEYRGEGDFLGWLATIARRQIAARHEYWTALRRRAGKALRLSLSGSQAIDPPGTATGPATRAVRREQVEIAMRALSALFPKDQELIRAALDGVALEETARSLGLSYEAAKKARLRAIQRFRQTYALAGRRGGGIKGSSPRG